MPERKYLDRHGFRNHPVVEMIMDAGKVNAADPGQLDVSSLCPDRWLRGEELECALKLHGKCIRSLRPIGDPPFDGFGNGSCPRY